MPAKKQDYISRNIRWFDIVALLVSLFSLAILIAVTVVILAPFLHSIKFVETECHFQRSVYHGTYDCEYCESSSSNKNTKQTCTSSSFPCNQVFVGYSTSGGENMNATFYNDVHRLIFYPQTECSFWICNKYSSDNRESVNNKLERWANEEEPTYQCFYNPDNMEQVIGQKSFTLQTVLLWTLIPLSLALVSTPLWIYHWVWCCKKEGKCCYKKQGNDEDADKEVPLSSL